MNSVANAIASFFQWLEVVLDPSDQRGRQHVKEYKLAKKANLIAYRIRKMELTIKEWKTKKEKKAHYNKKIKAYRAKIVKLWAAFEQTMVLD